MLDALRRNPSVPRFLVAGIAGLCWALAFPVPQVAGLAWIAPGLMLLSAVGASGRTAFRLGYVAGLVHYPIGLYWFLHMPVTFYPILGWLAISIFLSLYPACWVWLCWRLFPRANGFPAIDSGWSLSLPRCFAGTAWVERLSWSLLAAALWVTWEMIQARLFSGFPWNLLGASQFSMLLLIQVASFGGVFVVSFMVVWGSVSLMIAALELLRMPNQRLGWQREVSLPLLMVILVSAYGWARMGRKPLPGPTLDLALVQPSIPQTMIWDDQQNSTRFATLLELSRTALQQKPDLLVWPEAAVPYPVRYDTELQDAITRLLAGGSTWLAMGSDDVRVSLKNATTRQTNYYNSAFLIDPKGEIRGSYAKRQLVIFGEYVPLVKWLPFLRWFTPISGGFTPGEERVAFELPSHRVRFAPLICFEDMFAGVVSDQTQQDIQFLLNVTNDGWFGESAQQWQHKACASFRAIENGLPLVRCCNNGITCWIDSCGRAFAVPFPSGGSVYGVGIKQVRLQLPEMSRSEWTFYRRSGDLFGWGCVLLASAVAFGRLRRGRRALLSD